MERLNRGLGPNDCKTWKIIKNAPLGSQEAGRYCPYAGPCNGEDCMHVLEIINPKEVRVNPKEGRERFKRRYGIDVLPDGLMAISLEKALKMMGLET